jgi:hypothetical protein
MAALPPLVVPPAWTNQRLTLYHGTVLTAAESILDSGIALHRCNRYTDFGRGFYTTTLLEQAESWAWSLSSQRAESAPAVVRFDVERDGLARLDALWFVHGGREADDYWSLVHHCRTGGGTHGRTVKQGWYDVVIGPVAAFWLQRLAIHDADQISFHTRRAVRLLNGSDRQILSWRPGV